jgi:hypothetical protein
MAKSHFIGANSTLNRKIRFFPFSIDGGGGVRDNQPVEAVQDVVRG